MSCDAIRERYHDLLDGELAAGEERELRAHLETCASCRESFEALAAVVDVIREIPAPEPPPDLARTVLSRLPQKPRFGRLLWLAPLAAAAGLLLLASLAPRPEPAVRESTETARVRSEAPGARSPGALEERKDHADSAPGEPEIADDGATEAPGLAAPAEPTLGAPAPDPRPKAAAGDASLKAAGPGAPPAGSAAPPGAPRAAPAAESERGAPPAAKGEEWGSPVPTEVIRIRGEDPDTMAGVLLAELEHFRSRAATEEGKGAGPARRGGADRTACDEEVLKDRRGAPRALVLCVTPEEFRFVRTILDARRAREARATGSTAAPAPPPADAPDGKSRARDGGAPDGERPPGRRRIEIRFD